MKFKLASIAFIFLASQITFAASVQNKPDACPSISAIQNVGVSQAFKDSTWGWVAYNVNPYETDFTWAFVVIVKGQVDDESDAIKKGNASLSLFTETEGPVAVDSEKWGCVYKGENNLLGAAITPPPSQPYNKFMPAIFNHR